MHVAMPQSAARFTEQMSDIVNADGVPILIFRPRQQSRRSSTFVQGLLASQDFICLVSCSSFSSVYDFLLLSHTVDDYTFIVVFSDFS